MTRFRRSACLLLALLTLLSLAPAPAVAAGSVYFTAVNDHLLPLSDETMPFWTGGMLYVPYTVFDNNDLGVFFSRSRDKTTAVLYRQRSGAMLCDFTAGTITDNSDRLLSNGAPLTRGDIVFLPLDSVCRFFDLEYSYTRISYGYLVRVKNEAVVLSDATFIDAANSSMAQRYSRYERSKLPQEEEPVEPVEPVPAEEPAPPAPEEPVERSVYLAVDATSEAQAEQALAYLPSGRAAFLFTPQSLAGMAALLRRLAAENGSIALRVDGSAGAADALSQIEQGNRSLWTAANVKTRLVYLSGADEDTLRAVAEAGYCPLRFELDFSGALPSAARLSTRIFAAADSNGGSCRVLLGTDEAVAGSLVALLTAFRTGNCTPLRLTETALL